MTRYLMMHKIPANGRYRVGWRSGPEIADLPLIIAQSRDKSHYVMMTWFGNTYSLIGNENHPCFHADPFFEDKAYERPSGGNYSLLI